MKRFSTLIFGLLIFLNQETYAQTQQDTIDRIRQSQDTLRFDPSARPIFRSDTIKSISEPNGMKAQGMAMFSAGMRNPAVGKTTINLDVSQGGAATATIPITVPSGINGFTPEIALIYSSQSGNGIAGYGWSLAGASSITRIPATKYHNGKIADIRINDNDFFALDGQRLLLKTGVYGQPNAEYQTENYSTIRVFSRGSVTVLGNTAPDYFEVWYPDGSTAFYGSSSSSKTVVEYGVTYRRSNLGARINYTYSSANNMLKLLQISYGAIETNPSINVVNFTYQTAQRPEQSYIWGQNLSRDFIMTKISVSVSGTAIRHYELSNGYDAFIGYQRLGGVTETNGDASEVLASNFLSYGNTSGDLIFPSINNLSVTGITSNNSDAIFADFTGNGTLDFLVRPKTKDKFWTFLDIEQNSSNMQFAEQVNAPHKEVFPVRMLTHNSKLQVEDGFAIVVDQYDSYKFDVLSRGFISTIQSQYDRTWELPRTYEYYSECDRMFHQGTPLDQELVSGDFNGDGLTDIIAIGKPQFSVPFYKRLVGPEWNPPTNPWDPQPPVTEPIEIGCITEYADFYYSQIHFVNLDRRITSNFVTPVGALSKPFTSGDKIYTADFNGDGKTDILHISSGMMYVYSMNSDNTAMVTLWQYSDPQINLSQAFYIGDFNGDGKTDVMISTSAARTFVLLMSKGNDFKKHTQNLPAPFGRGQVNEFYQNGQLHQTMSTMLVVDVNGDGKSDIVQIGTAAIYGVSTGTIRVLKLDNLGYTESGGINFVYNWTLDQERPANVIPNPIPVVLSLDKVNHRLEVGWLSGNTLSTFQFTADVQKAGQLTRIWNNYETHDITYAKLMSNAAPSPDGTLYVPGISQNYPNVDFVNAPGLQVVSKISNAYNNTNHLQQVFSYGEAVSNMEGLGFLGFGRIARSNWHVSHSDPIKMFDITYTDPQLRGIVTKNFRSRQPYISAGVLSSPVASDGATIGDYVSRTDIGYQTDLYPNKTFVAIPNINSSKDLLNNTTNIITIEHDSYFNAKKITTNVNNEATKVEEATYDNNPNGYYVGRALTHKSTTTVGADSHVNEMEISYNGFLPGQVKKRANGSAWNIENLTYDVYGNITQQSNTTISGTRTTSTVFDATGRFPISRTGIDGLISTSTFDLVKGKPLTSTNSFGKTTTYSYDSWGRLIETTDYLGKTTGQIYSQGSGTTHTVATYDDEGRGQTSYFNALGQEIFKEIETVLGSVVGQAFEYDIYRRPYRQSQQADLGNYNQWDVNEYDDYGRIKKITTYTGKTISFFYNGLTTTEINGNKTVITERNALGQIISRQDAGGKIYYSYYAHGGLKSATLGTSVQSLEYDAWGKRTKLLDPSGGQYQYAYNGFGDITHELTPKGATEYTYDNSNGQLLTKTVIGDGTNLGYTYNYNSTTKLLESMVFSNSDGNNTNYNYTYDSHHRVSSATEDNQYAKFTRNYDYDSFGRISTETYQAKDKSTNVTVSRSVGYEYQRGRLLKLTDLSSGKIISKINSLKQNGQLESEQQGDNLTTTYSYDIYNNPSSTVTNRVGSSPGVTMALGYGFDAERGNLLNRSNSSTGYSDTFAYDNLNRLIAYGDGVNNNSLNYDDRGRITFNSQLGNYNYTGDSYKLSELTNLVAAAQSWYQSRAVQQITYNAFKKPININEQGIEQIDFQYNSALQRSHMFYGSSDADKLVRPLRRHYSQDGSMEITRDINTNRTSFVFYLGGDAYNAPAIYKELHKPAGSMGSLYYLHRDNLGSIVLISDVDGNTVEKRQFDPWGNIIKLEDGLGNALTAFQIIDRGYTGHEHLLGVGLINMNGRLYDPKLHRFLSPDNYVQNPYDSQNFNRYGYTNNNPLIASDPNGEFVHLILGAVFGGLANWLINGAELSWKGLAHFGVGAAGGLLGAGIGAGVSSALAGGSFGAGFLGSAAAKAVGSGFLSGAIVGAAGGATGGLVTSTGNALINGMGVGESLLVGLKSAGLGAVFGGLVGGIVNGIKALSESTNFWTGEGARYSTDIYGGAGSGEVYYSNESASDFAFSHEEIRKLQPNVDELFADGTAARRTYFDEPTGYFKDSKGNQILGVTDRIGVFKKRTVVYLAKAAFVSREQLYMTMYHEYIHGYFFTNGIPMSLKQEHAIIDQWHAAQMSEWAPRNLTFTSDYFNRVKATNQMMYLIYGFKTIKYLP